MDFSQPIAPESHTALRVHRMRVARGACWVITLALIAAALVTLIDAAAWLPGWVRGLCLAIWLTGFGVLTWVFVLRRSSIARSHNPARVAAKELPENIQAAVVTAILIVSCLLASVFIPNATEHIRRVAVPWYRPAIAPYWIMVTSNDPVVRFGDSVTLTAYVEKRDHSSPIPDEAILIWRDGAGHELTQNMIGDGPGRFYAT